MGGILYGVGVGPGDPELLTLKAARIIRACDLVAVPDSGTGENIALEIARAHVGEKPLLLCDMPMTRSGAALEQCRKAVAARICEQLEQGKTVAFLTLGDPAIYSTYLYIHRLVEAGGYRAEMVPGVPSFCAAAAALGMPLCEAGQPLHIIPASYDKAEDLIAPGGVTVFMKAGKKAAELLELLREKNLLANTAMAERVGMKGQRLVKDASHLEGEPGYFSLFIVKEKNDGT